MLQGPRKGRSFMFDRHDTFIVGRSRFVHCPMPEDMALSRDHFMIEINPPQCEMSDLGSTNGTFVNNQQVDRARLASGDVIAAGQSVFRVRVELDARSRAARSGRDRVSAATATAQAAIRCAGCGTAGPAEHHGGRADPGRCDRGRRVVVRALPFRVRVVAAAGPLLHHAARARPRGDGGGLPGPAQPDRADGRARS